MKTAIAQLNFTVGNLDYNTKKIIDCIITAESDNAELIIFSELAICGYSPLDLLEHKNFIIKCSLKLDEICKHTKNIAVIIGIPTINANTKGKNLYNSAAFLYDGKVQKLIHKTLLPSYDVFDENRYFEPNDTFEIIEFKNKKIAITICEDLWDEQTTKGLFDREMLYKNSPLEFLKGFKPDVVVNISGSPYSYSQADNRREILYKNAVKYSLPIIYVNQVGANTDLIFDGGSTVINKAGNTILQCAYFDEDYKFINLDEINDVAPLFRTELALKKNKFEFIHNALVLGIRDYFRKSGFKKAVIGLSGGIDSAVTVALALNALGSDNVDVILMPTKFSSNHSVDDSVEMAKRCNIKHQIINIENLRLEFLETLSEVFKDAKPNVTEENIQARIRGSILMAYSNKFGHILLNPSNKSEAAVGYTTLYGDMCGALSVIGDVYKTDVYALATFINKTYNNIIPENIINKAPSAELSPNQKDSDSLPDYETLDRILFAYIEQKKCAETIIDAGFDPGTVNKVIKLVNNNEFKRFQAPPILRISSKAFGLGRRMPIVANL